MEKFQEFYIGKQQKTSRLSVKSMLQTPGQPKNLATERRNNQQRNMMSNFSRHKAAGSQAVQSDISRRENNKSGMSLVSSPKATPIVDKEKFVLGTLDKFNELQQQQRIKRKNQQLMSSDYASSVHQRDNSRMSRNTKAPDEDGVRSSRGRSQLGTKHNLPKIKNQVIMVPTKIPTLPALTTSTQRQQQSAEITVNSLNTSRNQEALAKRLGIANSLDLDETGETILQLPANTLSGKDKNQQIISKQQQRKMEAQNNDYSVTKSGNQSMLIQIKTEGMPDLQQDSARSDSRSLERSMEGLESPNKLTVNKQNSNLKGRVNKLEQISKVYMNNSALLPMNRDGSSLKKISDPKSIKNNNSLQQASTIQQQKIRLESKLSQHQNVIDLIQASAKKRQASEIRQGIKSSKYSVSQADKQYVMKASDRLISNLKDHDIQSMVDRQHLPSLQTGYGGATRNLESEAATKNYEDQLDKDASGMALPRKFSQVQPAHKKEPLSLQVPKEPLNSKSSLSNTNAFKKVSQKRPPHQSIYLNQQSVIHPLVSSTDNKGSSIKRMKIDAQMYPVNNSKTFKPLALGSKQNLNAAYSRSNSKGNSDSSDLMNQNFKTEMEFMNPYIGSEATMDVPTKIYEPIAYERGSIRLPDLVHDKKPKANTGQMRTKRQSQQPVGSRGLVSDSPPMSSMNSKNKRSVILSDRRLAQIQSHDKSFESSVGSVKGLVKASFVPVLDEKRAEQLRKSTLSKESINLKRQVPGSNTTSRDDLGYKTVQKLPDTPFAEQQSLVNQDSRPMSPKIIASMQQSQERDEASLIQKNASSNILVVETLTTQKQQESEQIEIVDDDDQGTADKIHTESNETVNKNPVSGGKEEGQAMDVENKAIKLTESQEKLIIENSNLVIQPLQLQKQDAQKLDKNPQKSKRANSNRRNSFDSRSSRMMRESGSPKKSTAGGGTDAAPLVKQQRKASIQIVAKENITISQPASRTFKEVSTSVVKKQPAAIKNLDQTYLKRSETVKAGKKSAVSAAEKYLQDKSKPQNYSKVSIGGAQTREQDTFKREPSFESLKSPGKQVKKTQKRGQSIGTSAEKSGGFEYSKSALNQQSEERSPSTKGSQLTNKPAAKKQSLQERNSNLAKAYKMDLDLALPVSFNSKSRHQNTNKSEQKEVAAASGGTTVASNKPTSKDANQAMKKSKDQLSMPAQSAQSTKQNPAPASQEETKTNNRNKKPADIKELSLSMIQSTTNKRRQNNSLVVMKKLKDPQSKEKFASVIEENKLKSSKNVVLNKDLISLDKSTNEQDSGAPRLQEQQSQQSNEHQTKKVGAQASSPTKISTNTPNKQYVNEKFDRFQKAKQFDQQRRKLEKQGAGQSSSHSIINNQTGYQQEQKTKGLLRMMDSTASLNNVNHQASDHQIITATTPTTVKPSHRQQKNSPSKAKQQQKSNRKRYGLTDFEMQKVLGTGSFGQVSLVKHKLTGELYALKQIQKERIRGDKHIQHVKNEKNIMKEISLVQQPQSDSNHTSFFVNFVESMQDEQNLYILLEYLSGGELLQQIKQQMSLTLEDSVFYLAEVLVAIQQLHERNIIYRDLKPENILLDRQGHIKLIDFGFAKKVSNVQSHRARTNCGTQAYAAPEVVIGTGYNYKADIWSFGILICELLGGFTPFGPKAMEIAVAQDNGGFDSGSMTAGVSSMPPQQIIEMVNSGRIVLPKNLTPVTRDIVRKILVADPNVRLEIRDIMQHKFFEGVDWQKVSRKQNNPPYVPEDHSVRNSVEMEQQGLTALDLSINLGAAYTNEAQTTASNSMMSRPRKIKVGSNMSTKSSPYIQRKNPNKILGDFHLTKLNQVFEDF